MADSTAFSYRVDIKFGECATTKCVIWRKKYKKAIECNMQSTDENLPDNFDK